MMPDRIHIRRAAPRRSSPYAWVPDGLVAAVLAALVVTVAVFLRLLLQVRDKVGIGEDRIWAFLIGFGVIELYLLLRLRAQLRRVRSRWGERRSEEPGSGTDRP